MREAAARRRGVRADARDDQHHGARPRAAAGGDPAGSGRPRRHAVPFPRPRARHLAAYRLAGADGRARPARQSLAAHLAGRGASPPATTRSTCSTSISAGGESYRESANYEPGREAVVANLPWGQLGMTICYDLRFPHLHRALAQGGRTLPGRSGRVYQTDRNRPLAYAAARSRHRVPVLRVRRRAGRKTRKWPRNLRPQPRCLTLG